MESFGILAEVAIGIAGFGSVAIVLGRDHAGWKPAEFFRTASLFLASLGALFLAILPIGLATSKLAPDRIWQVSSAVMLTYIAIFSVLMIRWRRRYLDRELWVGPILFSLLVGTTGANILAQALNLSSVVFQPNSTCYFFGVVWFLSYGCLLLMRIVFIPPSQR